MKNQLILAAVLGAAAFSTANAQATLPVYETFSYETGVLAGNLNWTALNTGIAPTVTSNDEVSLPGGNFQEALLGYTSTTAGTVYFSLSLTVTTLPTGASYQFALSNSNTLYGAAVWLNPTTGGFVLGVSNRSNSTPTYDTTVFAAGTEIFLVGSYTFNEGTGNDSSSLWVNPTPSVTAPPATVSATGGTDLAALSQFLVRGATGSAAGLIDDLRVGTSWSAVAPIPEPSTYAAIFGGLVLVGAMIRRRAVRRA